MKASLFIFMFVGVSFVSVGAQADGRDVILQYGDVKVSSYDVERYIASEIPAESLSNAMADPSLVKKVAENIFMVRYLADEAKNDPSLDKKVVEWRANYAVDRAYMEANLAWHVIKTMRDIDWDARAKEAYIAEKRQFKTETEVHAAHILIKATDRSEEEAKELAESIRERAMSGEDFDTLAKEHSEGPSAVRGGDLGFFSKGRMAAEFEQASFTLVADGDISPVTKTQFGYHVIKRLAYNPAGYQSFEEVKEQIIDDLQATMKKELHQNKVMLARSVEGVDVNDELMRELIEKYKPSPAQK